MQAQAAKSRSDVAWLRACICELASASGVPVEIVERLYATEIERLTRGARIKEFVPVLAANNVRRQLRDLRHRRAA